MELPIDETEVKMLLTALAQRFFYLAADIKNAPQTYNERLFILRFANRITNLDDSLNTKVFKALIDNA